MVTIEELLQRVQRLEALVGEHVPVIEADSDQESKRDFVQEIALRPDPEFDASSYRENVDARDDEDADAPDDEQVASLRHRMWMRAAEYWRKRALECEGGRNANEPVWNRPASEAAADDLRSKVRADIEERGIAWYRHLLSVAEKDRDQWRDRHAELQQAHSRLKQQHKALVKRVAEIAALSQRAAAKGG